MSFWSTSTGENAAQTATPEYDAGGGGFITIPDGSTVLAFIKDAKWSSDKDNNNYIKIEWKVEQPEAVAGAVVFQKLWVTDDDPQAKDPAKKRDKALKMLATIDNNAGGKLAANGGQPTDDALAIALMNKQMAITCKIWEITKDDGSKMTGNWVAAVSAKGKELKLTADPIEQEPTAGDKELDVGEVPF